MLDWARDTSCAGQRFAPVAARADADENWQALLDHLDRDPPALVIHTGDISLNGADDIGDLQHARQQLNRMGVPWMVIPGNHDIGDFGATPQPVNDERRQRYIAVFGGDRWSTRIDNWHLIGLDVQTLVSELPAAPEMWEWLAGQLDETSPTADLDPPPAAADDGRRGRRPEPLHPTASGDRLRALLASTNVRLIASGHVHQWRVIDSACKQVWAPSTWAALPDRIQPVIGTKSVGIVDHELRSDDSVSSTFVQPRGIADVIVGDDFPSPYQH